MSTGENDLGNGPGTAEAEEPKRKLDLEVEITDVGPCKKHLKVAISRADIDHQFDQSLGEVKREAQVPGFRPGHAPRSLVERRFRKEVSGQVKSALLMAALEQLDEEHELNAISQPELDLEAISLPEDGPLRFEIDVEVEPEFTLPAYKAVTVQKPTRTIREEDVRAQMERFLERYAQLVPKLEGGAEQGDFVTADLTFHKDGVTLNQAREIQFRLQPELRFQDGRVPDLETALAGARPGDAREAEAVVGSASPDPALRGQTIRVTFQVQDLKRLRLPEVDAEFLNSIGFESREELEQALREVLERRVAFQQRQAVRRSILDHLLAETPFDLPADLVARQERTTLRRHVEEMKQAGMSDSEIRARQAEIRANAHESTLRDLKEFFLLAKIAEAEGLKVEAEDLNEEIEAIAARTDESPRRVRARIEKEGLAESLASQILERKTIDRILEFAKVEEVAMGEERGVETLDESAAPEIAEAPGEAASRAEAEAEAEAEPGA